MDRIRVIMAQLSKDLLFLRRRHGASESSGRNQRPGLIEEPPSWLVDMGFMSPYAYVTGDTDPNWYSGSHIGENLLAHGLIDEDQLDSLRNPSDLYKAEKQKLQEKITELEALFRDGQINEEQRSEAYKDLKSDFFFRNPDLSDEEMKRQIDKAGRTIRVFETEIEGALRLGFVEEDQLADVLAERLGLPRVSLRDVELNPDVLKSLDSSIAGQLFCVPFSVTRGTFSVAMADPTHPPTVDLICSKLGGDIRVSVTTISDARWALKAVGYLR
ncbi:hypothetical protein ACFL2Q_02595 [Thermodesulfobacteriota bacterium]